MTRDAEPTPHARFYAHARLYDLAFAWRDVASECGFMLEQAARVGCEVRTCLELASGPSRHALWMGAQPGVRAHALDLSQAMLDHAAGLADAHDADVTFHRADMCDFTLDGARVDLAFCLIDSIAYILDHDAFRAHLDAVATSLRDGGVYVIETNHPKSPLGVEATTETSWSIDLEGSTLHVTYGLDSDPFDPVSQVTQTTVVLREQRGDDVLVELTEVCPTRLYLYSELTALIHGSPFELVGRWGAMDADVSIDDPERAWRTVLMLQKKATG